MPFILYAIIDNDQIKGTPANLIYLISEKYKVTLEIISGNTISAFVSKTSSSKVDTSQDNVLKHAALVEVISSSYSILPMRYGSVLISQEEVLFLLDKNAAAFQHVLGQIYHKEEYSVRVLFSSSHNHEDKRENFDTPEESIPLVLQGNTANKNYLLKKYQNHTIEERRKKYSDDVKNVFTDDIQKLTSCYEVKKPHTAAFLLDAVVLIDSHKKNELIDIVVKMQAMYPQHNVILTGPWPPYSFTNIKTQYNG
jgi:Gas vesicle synthesis protein GvpL/GvpF